MNITIRRVSADDVDEVATMVGELLAEIMNATGVPAFNFDLAQTTARLKDFIDQAQYAVFVASDDDAMVGFVTVCESLALYAEGRLGIIPELFVRPQFRSFGVGAQLLEQVKSFGAARGWRRLEVTTPPLPQFDRTLVFYERCGFAVTGGRKMKALLGS